MKKITVISVLFFILIIPFKGEAASFSVSSVKSEIGLGGNTEMSIYIDTQGEKINAIEGTVEIPKNLKILDVSDGNSIISFWVEKPKVGDTSIHFSGIVPGGYSGSKGFLFSINVEGNSLGNSEVGFSGLSALLNDGSGTLAKTSYKKYSIFVNGNSKDEESIPVPDSDIPESFTPIISKDTNLFDGKYFVVFSAQDKISGIDHYDIAEKVGFKSFSYKNLPFVTAESPYVLSDQMLRSNIYIRAVDKQGNMRIETISPENAPLIYNYDFIFAILILITIVILYFVRRKNGNSSSTFKDNFSSE